MRVVQCTFERAHNSEADKIRLKSHKVQLVVYIPGRTIKVIK